jgi:hypothetical protein
MFRKMTGVAGPMILLLLLTGGCKTAEITYLGFIETKYPSTKVSDQKSAPGGLPGGNDTILCAKADIELLGDPFPDLSNVQNNIKNSYFDTFYPRKYELLVRKYSDSSYITVNSIDSASLSTNLPAGNEPGGFTIKGHIYRADPGTPSQNNFIILTSIPLKVSTYTNSSGFFEFKNINRSDISLMVFDPYTYKFIEIPLKLKNLSSLNQINILLTAR